LSCERSLARIAQHLPRDVTWYDDPREAREIKDLRCAGFVIRRGDLAQIDGSLLQAPLAGGGRSGEGRPGAAQAEVAEHLTVVKCHEESRL